MTNITKTAPAVTLSALATEAAASYAEAVTNNTGKGRAAVQAFDALNRAISDGLKKGEAADTLAVYFQDALTARGSKEKCGSNKVTQLALAADQSLSNGVKRTEVAVVGAVYLARVGKVQGGADAIGAALAASKGKPASERAALIERLPRAEAAPKRKTLTVEAVQKFADEIVANGWSRDDAKAVALILATAAEAVEATATAVASA